VKGKEYFRYSVVISPDDVKELGWKEGDELHPMRAGATLILKKEKRNRTTDVGDRAQESDA
jgi:formylmethanofuran dehydrogenase subunit D